MGKRQRNDLVDRVQYVGLRLLSIALHTFPVGTNLRTAKLVGSLVFRIDRRHRERAMGNLRRSFPDMPDAVRMQMAERSVQQLISLLVEVLFTTRLIHIDTWTRYVDLENFQAVIGHLLDRKRGLIMLTGHYGNWEVLGYTLATLNFHTTSIARPLDNPYVNKWLLGVREKMGQRIIDKNGATNIVTEVLQNSGVVGFIADQNAGSKGMFVDFFGRKASTYKSIGLLAMQFEVPIVIGYARRVGTNFNFKIGVQDIIYPEDWKDQNDPLRYITQRYTKGIEDFVSADPGQYLWVHRRWKSRPRGEAPEQFD